MYQNGLDGQLVPQTYSMLAATMGVSPLRIQDVNFAFDDYFLFVNAKLTDGSPYFGKMG